MNTKLEIQISDSKITKLIEEEIVKQIMSDGRYMGRESKYGIKQGAEKATREYIYSQKEMIIEKVVERATVEIIKKGLPKLLENLGKTI